MSNKPFKITEEIIIKSNDYIPLADKIAMAKIIAEECIKPVEIGVQKIQSDEFLTLPQLWEENILLKQIYLMKFLLENYLNINVSENFNSQEYDKYAKDHVINQLERFKYENTEYRYKVYDLLTDFKEFKKYLDIEIYNLKSNKNNGLERFFAGITILSNPENIKKMVNELDALSEQIQNKQKKTKIETAKKQNQVSNSQTKEFVNNKD